MFAHVSLLIRVLPSLSKPTVSYCAGTVLRGNSQLEAIKYSTIEWFQKSRKLQQLVPQSGVSISMIPLA